MRVFFEFKSKIDDSTALELPSIYDSNASCAFRLTADIDFDTVSSPSPSKSDASDPDDIGVHIISTARLPQMCTNVSLANISSNSSVAEDDELGDGLRTGPPSLTKNQQQLDSGPSSLVTQASQSSPLARASSLTWVPGQVERRRRKLPEIPKTKKSKATGFPSLTASFQLFLFQFPLQQLCRIFSISKARWPTSWEARRAFRACSPSSRTHCWRSSARTCSTRTRAPTRTGCTAWVTLTADTARHTHRTTTKASRLQMLKIRLTHPSRRPLAAFLSVSSRCSKQLTADCINFFHDTTTSWRLRSATRFMYRKRLRTCGARV